MLGVVLAAHGEVAKALLKAAEGIVGPLPGVEALTLQSGENPEAMRARLVDAVRRIDDGTGVVMMCDMFGGTPSNVCLSTECGTSVEVVTGVNLPMVVKLATIRAEELPVREAAMQLAAYGQRHVTHATELLRERRRQAGEAPCAPRPAPTGVTAAPVR